MLETKPLNVLNQETQSKVDYSEEHISNYPLPPCALSRLASNFCELPALQQTTQSLLGSLEVSSSDATNS